MLYFLHLIIIGSVSAVGTFMVHLGHIVIYIIFTCLVLNPRARLDATGPALPACGAGTHRHRRPCRDPTSLPHTVCSGISCATPLPFRRGTTQVIGQQTGPGCEARGGRRVTWRSWHSSPCHPCRPHSPPFLSPARAVGRELAGHILRSAPKMPFCFKVV